MAKDTFLRILNALKLVTVEPYLFFILMGYMIRLVSFQSLLADRSCRNWHLFPQEVCDSIDNHSDHKAVAMETGNNMYAAVMLVSSLPAIIIAVFLGPWSDKYSRKYPLIIAAVGQLLESIASAVLVAFPGSSPLWYVIVSVFAGFSGGFIMSFSAAFSYMSDVTEERSRPARYAILEFANICAIVLGNFLGGIIFKAGGYLPVMISAPISFALASFYTALFVKETRPRVADQTCSVMAKDLFTVDNVKESIKTCTKKRPGNIRLQIWLLVWASCSVKFTDMGTLAISFNFARWMYGWDVTDFSQASTAFYIVNAIVTVGVVPFLSSTLRLHEAALGLIGMLSLTSKMVLSSVAYTSPFFYYAWIAGALNNSSGIGIRSRLSKLVNKDEVGRVFSLLATCESVTPLFGTLVFVQIYNSSLHTFPGLPYAASAIFLIPSILIFCWMMTLPTVSLGDYAKDEESNSRPLQTISSKYEKLVEEKL